MKKPYEKPVMILERFDTGEIFCSDPDTGFYRRFVREAEEARNPPIVSCEPLCGRTGCMQEAGGVWKV